MTPDAMRNRMTRTATTVAAGALLVAAQLVAASPAHAVCPAGQLEDPNTRICWSQAGSGGAFYTPGGGPCSPGQVGSCVGKINAAGPGPAPDAGWDMCHDPWVNRSGGMPCG